MSCQTCGSSLPPSLIHCPWCAAAGLDGDDSPGGTPERNSWCCLTGRDLALLEQLAAMHGEDSAIGRTVTAKLDGVVELRAAAPAGCVTLSSRVLFRVGGGPAIGRILVHWDRFFVPRLDLSLASPWGVALLGLKVGHEAPAFRKDGKFERLAAVTVRCRPADAADAAEEVGGPGASAASRSNVVPLARRSARSPRADWPSSFGDDPGPSAA